MLAYTTKLALIVIFLTTSSSIPTYQAYKIDVGEHPIIHLFQRDYNVGGMMAKRHASMPYRIVEDDYESSPFVGSSINYGKSDGRGRSIPLILMPNSADKEGDNLKWDLSNVDDNEVDDGGNKVLLNNLETPIESTIRVGEDGRTFQDNYNAVMRDEEHLPQSGLWGHQYMQGGAGEGNQNLSPNGIYKNLQEIKTDAYLPTYCDPPNPCPKGYSSDDNCLEDVKNTADFSREYQSQQDCLCDPEHMFDCPEDRTFIVPSKIDNTIMGPSRNSELQDFLKELEGKRKNHPVVAKKGKQMGRTSNNFEKSYDRSDIKEPALKRVAKKGLNMF